jgi:hypothetical protein
MYIFSHGWKHSEMTCLHSEQFIAKKGKHEAAWHS